MDQNAIKQVLEGVLSAAGEPAKISAISQAYEYTIEKAGPGQQFVGRPAGLYLALDRPLNDKTRFRHHLDQTGLDVDLRINACGDGFCLYVVYRTLPFVAPEPKLK